jgi:hypothetical protein
MSASTDDREWFEEFYFTCIEHAFEDIDIYADADKLAEGLWEFAEWVGDLVCVHWLLSEFENGGLMQFFINSTGILAPEAVSALRRMRLPEAAEALRRAVELFGSPYPRDKKDRYQILRTKAGLKFEDMEIMMWRAELFKNMEDQLEAVGTENIYARMNEYAKEHASETTA